MSLEVYQMLQCHQGLPIWYMHTRVYNYFKQQTCLSLFWMCMSPFFVCASNFLAVLFPKFTCFRVYFRKTAWCGIHKKPCYSKYRSFLRQKSFLKSLECENAKTILKRVLLWVLHAISVINKPWPPTLGIYILLYSAIHVFRTVGTSCCQSE